VPATRRIRYWLRDVHVGTPDEVIASLTLDPVVTDATDLILQVHPGDPGQAATPESLDLVSPTWRPRWAGHRRRRRRDGGDGDGDGIGRRRSPAPARSGCRRPVGFQKAARARGLR
jgi:hypothetical protein